jgi:hypothetical protein
MFRLGVIGQGNVHNPLYSILFMVLALGVGLHLFNKQGSKLIDVV